MVRIGRMYPAAEGKGKGAGRENYYLKDAVKMEIYGDLGVKLGVKEITAENYAKLYYGCNGKGRCVVPPGTNGEHRPGFDLCFTPDKSVTVLYQYGTAEQKEKIYSALNKTVRQTLDFVRDNLIQHRTSRRKEDGM